MGKKGPKNLQKQKLAFYQRGVCVRVCFFLRPHQDFRLFSEYLICTGSHVLLNSMLFCLISAISSLQLSACLSGRLMLRVELPAEQGDRVR